MPFLRINDCPHLRAWDSKSPDDIAKEWFENFRDPWPSVYEANTAIEEVEAVAAFSLSNPTKLTAYHVLRIASEDLNDAGIVPRCSTPGRTGVLRVDYRHWEIPGDEDKLKKLISLICQSVNRGEERLRCIGINAQKTLWEQFAICPPSQVIDEARRRCCRKLKNDKNQPPRPTPAQIRTELSNNPPEVPNERIQLPAFLKYQTRCKLGEAGTPEKDWLEAEKELREIYLNGIVEID